jgi:ribosome biogenesis protein ERB1
VRFSKVHLAPTLNLRLKEVVKMAPRATPAESSKAAQRKATRPAPPAAASAPSKAASGFSKKRAAPPPVEEDDEDEGFLNGDTLDMSDDEMVEGESGEEEEDEEAFPELDSGSDEGDDEDEEEDDEEDGSESGYNSSDIERLEDEDEDEEDSPFTTPSSSQENLTIDEKLSRMIAKSSSKPDEAIGTDGKISLAKDGKGRMVKSKFVEGSYIREYDEYEAGYGSESSTEDVS